MTMRYTDVGVPRGHGPGPRGMHRSKIHKDPDTRPRPATPARRPPSNGPDPSVGREARRPPPAVRGAGLRVQQGVRASPGVWGVDTSVALLQERL